MKIAFLLLLFTLPACLAFNATAGWQTLLKGPPVIIANGGSSGILPDQTDVAYYDAANSSLIPLAMLCDLQLTKDNLGVCRSGWNLSASTKLTDILTNTSTPSTYVLRGVPQTGYFSVDFNYTELNRTTAIQQNPARTPDFDGLFPILTPEYVAGGAGGEVYFWLNVEYPTFYQEHPGKNSLASYLTTFLKANPTAYLSATEVGILKLLKLTADRSRTSLVLKFLEPTAVEESTNTTYAAILSNLADVATYAGGILVPQSYIYPRRTPAPGDLQLGYYVDGATTLVQDAHRANLEVFVYGFRNDDFPSSYNSSFDPVQDALTYIGDSFHIDGFLTDFPTTYSQAINCYPDGYVKAPLASRGASKAVQNPLIISHNGASGDFPGCTMAAYMAAINDGADYIDCTVQITNDGVAICRESADLLMSTNVFSNQMLYQKYVFRYPELQAEQGVFTFDMPWSEVSGLKAIMYSPWQAHYQVRRDPANDGKEGIMTLDQFLSFAKNNSGIGIYVKLQHAYYLRTTKGLDLVDAVVTSLTTANLTNPSDKVFVASEDSSALAALANLMPGVKPVYVIPYTRDNPISVTPAVLQEIKQFTNTVTIDGRLIDPLDTFTGSLLQKTNVVQAAQALNMTVFYSFLSNEFIAYARDYRSDPVLQINSLIQEYKLNGLITDFPSTLYNFLNKNYCYQPLGGGTNVSKSTQKYPIFPVTPQTNQAMAPSPPLAVAEPPVSYMVPMSSPSPGPSANPNSATKLPSTLLFTSSIILILTFLVL